YAVWPYLNQCGRCFFRLFFPAISVGSEQIFIPAPEKSVYVTCPVPARNDFHGAVREQPFTLQAPSVGAVSHVSTSGVVRITGMASGDAAPFWLTRPSPRDSYR